MYLHIEKPSNDKHEPVVILISPRGTRARHQPHEMLQYSSKNKRMWACVTFKVAATRSRARCGFTDPHLWQLHNYVLHQTVRILILIVQIQRVFTSILSTYMSHSELQYLRQSFTYAGISLRYRKLITIPVFYCAVRTVVPVQLLSIFFQNFSDKLIFLSTVHLYILLVKLILLRM